MKRSPLPPRRCPLFPPTRWHRRQSRIDFHSWRRWFITHAREAGFDRAIVAAIVGQEVGNITDDLYSGGPSDARKRDCVEAVKLPDQVITAPSGPLQPAA
jgi:hypothetical protein